MSQNLNAQQMGMMGQQLPWHKATTIECKCGNKFFTEVFLMKKFPKTIIETPGEMKFPEDQIVPIAVLSCSKCGEIQKDMLPKQVQETIGL